MNAKVRLPNYYALVVGINVYKEAGFLTLGRAVQDADSIANILAHPKLGVAKPANVLVLRDKEAIKANIFDGIRSLASRIHKGDIFVVYWVGHAKSTEQGDDILLFPYDMSFESADKPKPDEAIGFLRDVVEILSKMRGQVVFIVDVCDFGPKFTATLDEFSGISMLTGVSDGQLALDGYFTRHLVNALQRPDSDVDGDGIVSLKEAHDSALTAMASDELISRHHKQSPAVIGRSVDSLALARTAAPKEVVRLELDDELPGELVGGGEIEINGQIAKLSFSQDRKVAFLGDGIKPKEGMIRLVPSNLKREFRGWIEKNKLRLFQDTYRKSYAIIIAIDDYRRTKNPQQGPTGFDPLAGMVAQAGELRNQLISLGFPATNIIELYDNRATSTAINEKLEAFWLGGAYADADRLLIFFAGHGSFVQETKTGYLVTYDYDRKRPTLTSVLMRDLTSRHFENIMAKHITVILDACSAGLALPKFAGPPDEIENLRRLRQFTVMQDQLSRKARNVLVAGTSEERVLVENGGVFSKYLIKGLSGAADLNNDGIIQFDELALYVKEEVRVHARQVGESQEPDSYIERERSHNAGELKTGGSTLFFR